MKIRFSLIYPVIALILTIQLGTTLAMRRISVDSLSHAMAESRQREVKQLAGSLTSQIAHEAEALRHRARSLQHNQQVINRFAPANANPKEAEEEGRLLRETLSRLAASHLTDFMILFNRNGEEIFTSAPEKKALPMPLGLVDALNGEYMLTTENLGDGWAMRAIVPFYGRDRRLEGALVLGKYINDAFLKSLTWHPGTDSSDFALAIGEAHGIVASIDEDGDLADINPLAPMTQVLTLKVAQTVEFPAQAKTIFYTIIPIGDQFFALAVEGDTSASFSTLAATTKKIDQTSLLILGLALAAGIGFSLYLILRLRNIRQKAISSAAQIIGTEIKSGEGNEINSLVKTIDALIEATRIHINNRINTEHNLARAREESEKARHEAEAASRAKSEFLANMSHEIRTPMNGIMGMTDLVLASHLTEEQKKYLLMAKTSSRRLLQVINDILDFSKIEAGSMELAPIPFNPRHLLDETVHLMAVAAHAKGLELISRFAPETPEVIIGDPDRLRQILFNLLGNAIKFTARGEISVRVTPEPFDPQQQALPDHDMAHPIILHFSVQDTGIGIPRDKQELIFESFTQADGSFTRKFGGTGLGLAISQLLVRMMGGKIWVESSPGKGAVFHFTVCLKQVLPASPSLAHAHETTSVLKDLSGEDRSSCHDIPPERSFSPAQKGGRKIRLLLAEDEFINRTLALMLLAQQGYEVQAVDNGQEALAALKENNFDLVVMDIQMPVMDGIEALHGIRAWGNSADAGLKAKAGIPVLALTANAIKGDREKYLAAGMNGYISKPIDPALLQEEIAKVLQQEK